MANNIQIVGGERSGEYIKWFGNRVRIQGVEHDLFKVTFEDDSILKYYVKRETPLLPLLGTSLVKSIVRME